MDGLLDVSECVRVCVDLPMLDLRLFVCVQVCDGGRVRVFGLDKRDGWIYSVR